MKILTDFRKTVETGVDSRLRFLQCSSQPLLMNSIYIITDWLNEVFFFNFVGSLIFKAQWNPLPGNRSARFACQYFSYFS